MEPPRGFINGVWARTEPELCVSGNFSSSKCGNLLLAIEESAVTTAGGFISAFVLLGNPGDGGEPGGETGDDPGG